MRSFFTFHLFWLTLLNHFTSYTFSLCYHHDRSALLQFKKSFVVNTSSTPDILDNRCSSFSFKTESWKNTTDCCEWDGITCDNMSHYVIGLDVSCNNLVGVLHPNNTIFQLRHLQQLNLAFNNFYWSPVHAGIGDLVGLTHLNLSNSHLSGNIPSTISHLSKLVSLDLSCYDGMCLELILYPFTWKKLIHNATNLRELYLNRVNMSLIRESSLSMLKNLSSSLISLSLAGTRLQRNFDIFSLHNLQTLDLSFNELNGEIPPLLSNLTHLTSCDLQENSFIGNIPNVYGNLNKLKYLELSSNSLTGQVPSSFFHLPQLSHLGLSFNKLVGPIPNEITKLSKLSYVDLGHNMLNGTIPHWCYYLPSLSELHLSNNHLTGFISEFSTHSLQYLYLSNNNLHGHFPHSIFELQNLTHLELSSTNLSGVVDFHQFSKFKKLKFLDLSHNSFLSINIDRKVESISSPYLEKLDLSFSNINSFPKFHPLQPNLQTLDLSNNNINGKIPTWFHNFLNSWEYIVYIDLSFNKLQGDIAIPPDSIQYFLLSNNNFTGDISPTFCNASMLKVLNLAHNKLTGMIPQCLVTLPSLSVLDLQMNNLYGSMSGNFSEENKFETIKLNGNHLEGPLPRSLAQCTNLEVLDLGDNIIEDVFPIWLGILPELQVLSLRSNKLYGTVTCSSSNDPFLRLRIFDVSNNNFIGPLPTSCIENFQGMRNLNNGNYTGLLYMEHGDGYYEDSVLVIMKGLSMELTRILTTFTTIDLSNNMFEGEIPTYIGELSSLKGLNISNNGISGNIPQSLSNLRNLEWLDLSRNQLKGEVPMALTKLNFLAFLNLSENHLEGMIPKGQQFDTFGNDSYEGNTMLCGLPLSKSCKNDEDRPPHSTSEEEDESGFGWKAVAIGYACGAISGLLLGHNVFFFGKPEWLARFVEHMFSMRLKRTNNRAGANRRRMN